ncbi:MFS transporter [Streptomyces sp. NPDC048331]|uniref:MFS transporter n=1 Tax=Streptomyces sp. NPDC048331 TaxID=3365534 RepID=UPI0037155C60
MAKNTPFRLLWAGQSVSVLGTAVTTLAFPLAAIQELDATPLQLGVLAAVGVLPPVLIALPAGALVDRRAKRPLMLLCHAGRAGLLATIPLAAVLDVLSMWQLYLIAFLNAVFTVIFDAAYQSYVPVVVGRDHLMVANGRISASDGFAQLSGPSLGGFLVGLLSASRAIAVDSLSYLLALVLLLFDRTKETTHQQSSGTTFRRQIVEGLKFVFTHPVLRAIACFNATNAVLLSWSNTVWLLYVVRELGWSSSAAGMVLGIGAAGAIIGGLAAPRIVRRYGMPRVLLVTALLDGPGQLPVLLVNPGLGGQVIVCTCYVILLFGVMVYNTAQRTYRQLESPEHMLGRVTASIRWIQWSVAPLGALLAGVTATVIGLHATILLGVVGLTLSVLFLYFSPLLAMARRSPTQPALHV